MDISRLHERHPGLTADLAGAYFEAACVCLHRYHAPPTTIRTHCRGEESEDLLEWTPPGPDVVRAHGNRSDAITFGAYALSVAAVEAHLGLVAVGRSGRATGCDYYIAPRGAGITPDGEIDLDDPSLLGFEVSGTDEEPAEGRLKEKVQQLRRGSVGVGIAAVVRFGGAGIHLAPVEEADQDA
jgi:hypothetical protein